MPHHQKGLIQRSKEQNTLETEHFLFIYDVIFALHLRDQ